jgi:hypothetical protein
LAKGFTEVGFTGCIPLLAVAKQYFGTNRHSIITTAMGFLEPRISRRRCEDHSNDLENPLLEATSSITEEGEHIQENSKVDPSTSHPKRLMLALFFALFIETMAIHDIALHISSQGRENFPDRSYP